VFLGAPGAGKGTQAERLKDDHQLVHLATGDLLRAAVKEGTELGLEAKKFMDAGDLVPDEVVVGMIRERLSGDGASDRFLLDGFPRTVAQGEALDAMLDELSAPLDHVLYLHVDREELVRRLAGRLICRRCGKSYHEVSAPYDGAPCEASATGEQCDLYEREDDKASSVENRLNVYERQTAPLIEYYRDRGLLREIDGQRAQDEVYGQITASLSEG
jgi:adenylate kinase